MNHQNHKQTPNSALYAQICHDYTLRKLRAIDRVADPDHALYVMEWLMQDNALYGIGLDPLTGRQAYFKARTGPGLYVWARDFSCLLLLRRIVYLDLTRNVEPINPDHRFSATGITAVDHLIGSRSVGDDWTMYKVPCQTYEMARSLYYLLSENPSLATYIKVPGKWATETFLMLELYARNQFSFNKCTMYGVYIDANLRRRAGPPPPEIETVAFDIETVSHDSTRVPLGDHLTDALFSASFTHIRPPHKGPNVQITMLNLPGSGRSAAALNHAHQLIRAEAEYPFKLERRVLIYSNEVELLRAVLALFKSISNYYLCLGYNSKGYDMMYLFKRAVFYNLPEAEEFVIQHQCLAYGFNMVHVDLMLLMQKLYKNEIHSYKLDNVAGTVLEEGHKVDLSAVEIRFIYMDMLRDGIPADGNFTRPDGRVISLSRIAYYNDVDSILCSRMWYELHYDTFIMDLCRNYYISMSRIPQGEISEQISMKMLHSALVQNYLFAPNHYQNVAINDCIHVAYDTRALASSGSKDSYGGGFNHREAKECYDNVHMCDYVAYYPYLIEGFNISYETTAIVTVEFLLRCMQLGYLSESRVQQYAVTFLRFTQHFLEDNSLSKAVDARCLLNGSMDNASEVQLQDLSRLPGTDRIIVLIRNRRGVLSEVMRTQNALRDSVKITYKQLGNLKDELSQQLSSMRMELMLAEELAKQKAAGGASDAKTKPAAGAGDDDDEEEEEEEELILGEGSGDGAGDGDDDEEEEEEELVLAPSASNDGNVDADKGDDGEDDDEEEEEEELLLLNASSPPSSPVAKRARLEEGAASASASASAHTATDDRGITFYSDSDLIQLRITIPPVHQRSRMTMAELEKLHAEVSAEYSRIHGIYRSMKILNNSIYGNLGANYGLLRGRHVAAIATCMGRKYIIETGKQAQQEGFRVVLMDTDSVFLHAPDTRQNRVPEIMRSLNHKLELNTKIYHKVFVIARKVYFYFHDEAHSKGVTKHGPAMWDKALMNIFQRYVMEDRGDALTFADIHQLCVQLFLDTYAQMRVDKTQALCTITPKEFETYKSQTPVQRLMRAVLDENPGYVFGKTLRYFFVLRNRVQEVHYEIDYKLEQTDLLDFNLFKFYSKIEKQLWALLMMALIRSNARQGVYISMNYAQFKNIFEAAFIEARRQEEQRVNGAATGTGTRVE